MPKIFGPKIVLVPKFLDQKCLDLYSFGPNFFKQKTTTTITTSTILMGFDTIEINHEALLMN